MDNVLELIGQLITLHKCGQYYYVTECIWCGFPTFAISIPRQIFYCFECSTSGNLEDFVSNYTAITVLPDEARKEMRDTLLEQARENKKKFQKEIRGLKMTKKEIEKQVKGLK